MTKPINPLSAAESLRLRIASGQIFSALICGPFGSGKTTALGEIVGIADRVGVTLNQIAAFAPTRAAVRRLRAIIGQRWPDLDPQTDLFSPELSGVPMDALRGHTALPGSLRPLRLDHVARGYLDIIRQANDFGNGVDPKFLAMVKPRVKTALRYDLDTRLRGEPLPRSAPLHAVANYLADYKAEHSLHDKADLAHGGLYVSPQIKLLLLDEIGDDDQQMLMRLFPNASVVATSLTARTADVVIELPRCLRRPERWNITVNKPSPFLIPAPQDFASLFILTPPWRRRVWTAWLRDNGLPPPPSPAWSALVAAWSLDQGGCVPAYRVNPLLKRAGLPMESDWLYREDIDGWRGWHDMAAGFDPLLATHADAVLARFGRLKFLPMVRLSMPRFVRYLEAEVVILDCESGMPKDDSAALAVSRATKRLIVLQGETSSQQLTL